MSNPETAKPDAEKIFVIAVSFISRMERDRAAKLINQALSNGAIHHSGLCLTEEDDDGE